MKLKCEPTSLNPMYMLFLPVHTAGTKKEKKFCQNSLGSVLQNSVFSPCWLHPSPFTILCCICSNWRWQYFWTTLIPQLSKTQKLNSQFPALKLVLHWLLVDIRTPSLQSDPLSSLAAFVFHHFRYTQP